jgi:hypothetical protein
MVNFRGFVHRLCTKTASEYEVNINFMLCTGPLDLFMYFLRRLAKLQKSTSMKWEAVASTIGYSVYALWNNGKKLVTLVFNSSSNAARIEYGDEKRVFLIRKEGFLKNKTVLRNEYGIHIGHTGTENNEDFIVLNNQRYFYSVNNNSKDPALTIYKDDKAQPIAVCELAVEEKDMLVDLAGRTKIKDDAKNSLLLTLCWYLFHPTQTQRPVEYSLA